MSNGEVFDFRIDHVIDIITKSGAEVVGLQFPEGFKRRSPQIASMIEDATGVRIIISGNPCFGACDLDSALLGSVDIMFHFGHAELDDTKLSEKVYFIDARSDVDVTFVAKKALQSLRGQRIGLITTVQHVHKLVGVREILEQNGKTCFIGEGDSKIAYPGQVLGCNFSAARVEGVGGEKCDEYLYIGSGDFHPLGVTLATKKRVVIADPLMNEVREVDHTQIMRQRSAVIGKSYDANVFGIIVSTKNGQNRMELAEQLKELAKKHDKTAHILSMDLITPDQLLQFKVDAFVNTACPRLAVDEIGRFNAPMLMPQEFEIVVGERKWDDIVFDEILGE
ncbi:MAG: diphthamide biosynthesis enzyme Dph2 [Methanosarcinaceae archaeon]|nr:diphthamide biosynthesis enzyme Dph2 [Methanosarcinaceae archaeon]MDF1534089.1 diphthamide biosynthesis enzyme Dph2 [Methanosarcinaceae archaeon]